MKLGVLKDKTIVALTGENLIRIPGLSGSDPLLNLVSSGNSEIEKLRDILSNSDAFEKADYTQFDIPIKNPSKIVAIGLNYIDHAKEAKLDVPKTPLVFAKFPSSITGPNDTIYIPKALTKKVDYEVELGIVIGKQAKNVNKSESMNYVFGYTVINDISARDIQFADGQWVRAKSLDTFCPMGPVIVTADEIKDPRNLRLVCEVNGEKLQDSSTSQMIFGVAELISFLSYAFTLEPGDIIATGTPSGVGFSRKPPVYLKDGDVVRTWIEGIGELVNPIKEI